MKRLYVLTLLFMGLLITQVDAANYFVATTGSDAADGSSATPWRTLQKAADTMVAGDTTTVRNGTYVEGALVFNTADGTAGSRITLQAQNRHQAILSSTSSCNPSIDFERSYITIDGLRIRVDATDVLCSSGTTANYYIQMWPPSRADINGNQNSTKRGGWVKNVLIDHPLGKRYGAIKISEDDGLVEDNIVYGEIETIATNNVIIRNNTVFGIKDNTIHAKGGARNTQIYNNVVHLTVGNFSYGIVAGGCSCTTCFYDDASRIELYNGAIYNNVVLNDHGSTTNRLFAFFSASNSKIFNNVGINGIPVEFSRGCGINATNTNPVFVNNILVDETGGASYSMGNVTDFTGTKTLNHNNFFGYSSPPTQSNAITGNPLFVNPASDWHLRPGSPAIDVGTVVTMPGYSGAPIVVNQTKDGMTRNVGSPWDLGPYGTNSVTGDITPPEPPTNVRVQ